ncbi:MAG TPA: hypothetical protein PK366_08685, partial [Fibrobacteraceae bacterium]|nr:hypothetical protein [Fibrobacteraceae bacterium]
SSEATAVGDESLKDFNKLHGNVYNTVGNIGASANVDGNLRAPHSMNGLNLAYLQSSLDYGLVSFTRGITYYLGLGNSDDVGLLTFGLATRGMGLSLDIGTGKTNVFGESANVKTSSSTVEEGDVFGLRFSMPMGGLELLTHFEWLTIEDQKSTDNGTTELNANYWDLMFEAEINNTPSAKDLYWAGGAKILRRNLRKETTTAGVTALNSDLDSHFEIAPHFDLAFNVLGNERARVLIGSNNTLGFQMFDKIDNTTDGRFELGLFLAPNIFAEIALTKNWMFFGGASHTLNVFSMSSEKYNDDSNDFTIQTLTEHTSAEIGTRFQWKSFALEASLSEAFFGALNKDNSDFNLNAFIYF